MLNRLLWNPPILSFPKPEKDFAVFLDTSRVAVGASLMQEKQTLPSLVCQQVTFKGRKKIQHF